MRSAERAALAAVLAPDLAVTIDPARFRSKSKNTPFGGWQLKGGVAATIVGGRLVYANEAVTSVREWRTQGAAV